MIPETGLRIIGDVGQRLQCGTVNVLVFPANCSRSVQAMGTTAINALPTLTGKVAMPEIEAAVAKMLKKLQSMIVS